MLYVWMSLIPFKKHTVRSSFRSILLFHPVSNLTMTTNTWLFHWVLLRGIWDVCSYRQVRFLALLLHAHFPPFTVTSAGNAQYQTNIKTPKLLLIFWGEVDLVKGVYCRQRRRLQFLTPGKKKFKSRSCHESLFVVASRPSCRLPQWVLWATAQPKSGPALVCSLGHRDQGPGRGESGNRDWASEREGSEIKETEMGKWFVTRHSDSLSMQIHFWVITYCDYLVPGRRLILIPGL